MNWPPNGVARPPVIASLEGPQLASPPHAPHISCPQRFQGWCLSLDFSFVFCFDFRKTDLSSHCASVPAHGSMGLRAPRWVSLLCPRSSVAVGSPAAIPLCELPRPRQASPPQEDLSPVLSGLLPPGAHSAGSGLHHLQGIQLPGGPCCPLLPAEDRPWEGGGAWLKGLRTPSCSGMLVG